MRRFFPLTALRACGGRRHFGSSSASAAQRRSSRTKRRQARLRSEEVGSAVATCSAPSILRVENRRQAVGSIPGGSFATARERVDHNRQSRAGAGGAQTGAQGGRRPIDLQARLCRIRGGERRFSFMASSRAAGPTAGWWTTWLTVRRQAQCWPPRSSSPRPRPRHASDRHDSSLHHLSPGSKRVSGDVNSSSRTLRCQIIRYATISSRIRHGVKRRASLNEPSRRPQSAMQLNEPGP